MFYSKFTNRHLSVTISGTLAVPNNVRCPIPPAARTANLISRGLCTRHLRNEPKDAAAGSPLAGCDISPCFLTCSGELRTQKLKSHLVRTHSLNVLPLKPRGGQERAIHATLTARDFFLANFYPSGPLICIFSKTSPEFFLC